MAYKRTGENETFCLNKEFKTGQLFVVNHGKIQRTMRVTSIKGDIVRFVDVNDSRIKCSGQLLYVPMPSCQSCNIEGCDMVFSFDALKV